ACDFVQVHDLLFRAIFAFIIIDVPTRRVAHVGVTRCPTDRWVTQQLREATAWDRAPKYLLLDNDSKFGAEFDALAQHTGIKLVHTAVGAPLMNSICERVIGSVRRECLDHVIILSEAGMRRLVLEYVRYFNEFRPHQGLGQQLPAVVGQRTSSPAKTTPALVSSDTDTVQRLDHAVVSVPVLGGLHHHYYRLAA
ncbi:MAG: integrase core domain-containing protein, partial [bacterium]